jgi:hypothetical protein
MRICSVRRRQIWMDEHVIAFPPTAVFQCMLNSKLNGRPESRGVKNLEPSFNLFVQHSFERCDRF